MEIRHKNWNKFFNMEWKSEYDNLREKYSSYLFD
jgi:hypothetical protein